MRDPNELVWLDTIPNDFWWSNFITGVEMRSIDDSLKILRVDPAQKFLTDSGTSCTYFPEPYFSVILDAIKAELPNWFLDQYGDVGLPCEEMRNAPTISFEMGDYWFEMLPEDYVIDMWGQCWLCLFENSWDEYWLLGDTFLRGYYSVHDYETMQFGFAPHSRSSKRAPYRTGDLERLQIEQRQKLIRNVSIVAGSLVAVIITLSVLLSM